MVFPSHFVNKLNLNIALGFAAMQICISSIDS